MKLQLLFSEQPSNLTAFGRSIKLLHLLYKVELTYPTKKTVMMKPVQDIVHR